ncbi:MAG: twin-arginine translocase TatA/TatE family subunit [Solirubrobacterales bacterium]
MFSGLESPAHLLIVLVVALLVLGPKRLPQVGRSLGSGIRQFKDSLEGKHEPEPEPEPESPEQPKAEEAPERTPSLGP